MKLAFLIMVSVGIDTNQKEKAEIIVCRYEHNPTSDNFIFIRRLIEDGVCIDFFSGFNSGIISCPAGNRKSKLLAAGTIYNAHCLLWIHNRQ